MECRICGNKELKLFLSLGKSPLANSFLKKGDLGKKEDYFPLELHFCDKCKLVQLGHIVPAEAMFRSYVYVTSTTNTFKAHFTKMAEDISKSFLIGKGSLAVDIGSNDGTLLKGFKSAGAEVIGVEPAANIAKIAEQSGIETINDFFNEKSANKIIAEKGNADVVTATNVFAHIGDIDSVAKNVKSLLKKDGVFVIEMQYFADTMEKMTFDNIYHEHLSYFTMASLDYFFKKHGMAVFDAQRVDSHGGSLRVFIKKSEGKFKTNESVAKLLAYEKKIGIDDFESYKKFADRVYGVKKKLVSCIKSIKKDNKKIAGYGAPAKGNTLLNFCNLGAGFIDYIVEDNPLKIGLYAPGTHIPVVSSKWLDEKMPDYILVLAWNFADEILAKTKKYADKGVKFIIPLPEIKILG